MSNNLLSAYARPHVIFDSSNAQHRKWAHRFLKDRNWSGCPVQFVLFNGDDNVISLIQRELMRFYLVKEFGRVPLDDHDRNYQKWVAELPSVEYSKK
jgi:hypothetical protein